MSRLTVESGQILDQAPVGIDESGRTGHDRRGRVQGPQRRDPRSLPHLCLAETRPIGTLRPNHLPVRRRAQSRTQPPPTQVLSARGDHRARSRAGSPRRGVRRQLLCRPRVRGRQTGEPAAPRQGPAQGALRRQDSGFVGRGHSGWSRRRRKAFNHEPAEPHEHEAVYLDRITRRGGSCAPRSTRPSRCRSTTRSTRWSSSDTISFCSTTSRPNGRRVVYRRHAYDYGLIRLA